MTTPTLELTVLPPAEPLDDLVAMLSRLDSEPTPRCSYRFREALPGSQRCVVRCVRELAKKRPAAE